MISPSWALRRAKSRAMLEAGREYGVFNFRGGTPGRLDSPWPRQLGITGQTYQDRFELRSMRDRSRHIDDNNPIGKGMLNRLVDNVIGEGFALQAKTQGEDFNKEVDEIFETFLEDADVRGMVPGRQQMRLMYRGHECDGDTGMVLVSKGGEPKLQSIQADQIYQPDGEALTPTFLDGVEMDRAGKPIRYHVLDCPQGGVRKFTPIPAQNFIFLPRFTRYGNGVVRGEPCFSTTYTYFDQLDGYVDAVVVAARMAAIFGLVFKESTGAQQLGAMPMLAGSNGDLRRAFTIENGQVKFIGNKDSIAQVQASQPMQQTPDFIACIMRLIGLPVDMPLELTLLDFSRVNYSSARAAFLQFYQAMIPKQQYFRTKVMSRVYRWWLDLMLRQDRIRSPVPADYYKHHFMPRGWQWVDPVREAQAALLEIAMGVNSPQRVAARLGRNYEQILAEVAADAKARNVYGLPLNISSMTREAMGAVLAASDEKAAKNAELQGKANPGAAAAMAAAAYDPDADPHGELWTN